MFVGHYGVSYAAKRIAPTVPLWVLFLAVQLVDVFWGIFVLTGIERVRIVPGITATNPLDLYYMPYTHSLLASFVWAAVGFFGWRLWRRGSGRTAALVVAAAILSHWFLDLIVHIPDLPLYDNTAKVGLGLWNRPFLALGLELVLLYGGLIWYLRGTRGVGGAKATGMVVFAVVMAAVHATTFFGAPPTSPALAAGMALGAYFAFAAIAAWLERRRVPREA